MVRVIISTQQPYDIYFTDKSYNPSEASPLFYAPPLATTKHLIVFLPAALRHGHGNVLLVVLGTVSFLRYSLVPIIRPGSFIFSQAKSPLSRTN